MPKMFIKRLAALLLAVCACSSDADGKLITKTQLGERWPLTIDSIRVKCINGQQAVGVADGTTYALNGLASQQRKYQEIDAIWRDNPDPAIPKVNIGPLIDSALTMCK
jgi:hypothetical protein